MTKLDLSHIQNKYNGTSLFQPATAQVQYFDI